MLTWVIPRAQLVGDFFQRTLTAIVHLATGLAQFKASVSRMAVATTIAALEALPTIKIVVAS